MRCLGDWPALRRIGRCFGNWGGGDLTDAVFNQTDLTGADLSTALNYAIDPELNTIKKAIFSITGLPGLLTRYQIKIV